MGTEGEAKAAQGWRRGRSEGAVGGEDMHAQKKGSNIFRWLLLKLDTQTKLFVRP